MSSSSWFERHKKFSIGVGVAAVVGAVAVGAYMMTKKPKKVATHTTSGSETPSLAQIAMKYHKLGAHQESIKAWTDAILDDPSNFKYYTNRAQSYILVNEYELALKDAESAIKLNAEAAVGHYHRGRAALKLERFEDAAASFTTALKQADASKIAAQAQTMLKTCQESIKKIRDSRLTSVAAGAKKPSPVNTRSVSPTNVNKTSPTTSPVANATTTAATTAATAAAKKHTEQVAHVASAILEHAKAPVVEPVKATLPNAAAVRSPSPAPTVSSASPASSLPSTSSSSSSSSSSSQLDLSSSSKIAAYLTEMKQNAAEVEQKQKAIAAAEKIVEHYAPTTTTATTTPATTTAAAAAAASSTAKPAATNSTNTTTTTPATAAPVQIPSIFTPTSQNKAESPVSPISDNGSSSGIFERSAVYVNDAHTPPNKSRLSFMSPDLISDTTTIDADTAVPIDQFASFVTGTPLQTPPSVFRTLSSSGSASTESTSTSASASASTSKPSTSNNSSTTSPVLVNKPLPKSTPVAETTAKAPLAFASENPLDEM